MATFAEAAHRRPSAVARSAAAPPARPRHPKDPLASRSLAALVAGEIIPRLMLAHGAVDEGGATPPLDVDSFTPLTLEGDARGLFAHIDRLVALGVPVDTLMVDLLAPAARMLGVWWEEDRCDFVEVTMGLWRLQEVVRDLAQRVAQPPRLAGRRALFATFPGEQHGFGAVMVSDIFHRHGWEAETLVGEGMPGLLAEIGRRDYDLVGLTVSCDCHRDRLPSAILALRSVSRNPQLRVLVGGRVLNEDPALAGRVGADGTALDAIAALALAERLVDAATRDCAVCG